jgi:uncharacterized protein involved in type VI secretion and phage assembly
MSGEAERLLERLAHAVERRFYGKYRALVVDNEDPEKLGRLRVRVPSVLGDQVVTGWASACVPWGGDMNRGFLFVPDVGAGVWIEFEEGDLEFPVWVGTFWSKPGGDSEVPKPNGPDGVEAGAVQDPPTRRIIKSTRGHTVQMEDAEDDGELRILVCDGQNENRILFSSKGITITGRDNTVTMGDDGVVIEDRNGNTVTQESSGTTVKDANGNEIVMGPAGIRLGSGSAADPFVLGQQFAAQVQSFMTALATHTHVGNLGAPTSPPMAPMTLTVPLSAKHKVE